MVLFLSNDQKADLDRLGEIAKERSGKLYIHCEDRAKYQQYLRNNWRTLAESQPVEVRVMMLGEVMRDVLRSEFVVPDTERIVLVSKQLAKDTCLAIENQSVTVHQLCNVLHHDFATFTHVSNVSLYCTLLGREFGFVGDELEQIALGGLLHDIGKLQIDEAILSKPGRLSDSEFAVIKKHPIIGFRELAERDDLSDGQLMMCYQHHERLNGTGYPVGCLDADIHPWAKLCAITDVFEALTANRPYRKPMSLKTALAVLEKGRGEEFDPEMLDSWHRLVGEGASDVA